VEAAAFQRQLLELVDTPREDLAIELKEWLDLSDRVVRANVGRELLGLANHGGGYLVFGFDDSEAGWTASGECPYELTQYSQDAINAICERHAEPSFHCNVHRVTSSAEITHVVIAVPGGHRVPIRSKRAPEGSRLVNDRYYIRRPGPQTAPVSSGQEWDDLIRRCIGAQRSELVESFRSVVSALGPEGAREIFEELAGADDPLVEWEAAGRARLEELVAIRLAGESPSRYAHGTWSFAYALGSPSRRPSLSELNEILMRIAGHETGWPPWWYPTREPIRPHPIDGLIECWMAEPDAEDEVFPDGAHSDLWRGDPQGRMFLIRGYQEDGELATRAPARTPGSTFEVTTVVWRIGECLLHAARLAAELDSATVRVLVRWDGLEGRHLSSFNQTDFFLPGTYIARQDSVISAASADTSRLAENLPEVVREIVQPLYEVFDFYAPPDRFYATQLGRMLSGA
jgi:transcriptional regulator with XRE-family HTH domain